MRGQSNRQTLDALSEDSQDKSDDGVLEAPSPSKVKTKKVG